MAYSEGVKNRAYTLFLIGKNPEQIASILKADDSKISANTIRRWAETPDGPEPHGETWYQKRVQVDQASKQRIQEAATNERSKIKSTTSLMLGAVQNAFLDKAGEMIGKAKDPVSLGYLWQSLAKQSLLLEESENGAIDLIELSRTLLDVFNLGPKTKKALKEEWGSHQKNLMRWLEQSSKIKDVDGIVIEGPRD
ncbi:hypothetical protein [Leptospira weilii]|uniref:Terminase n=1 Tax=Leptospira weilii str. UI 13098 TaxID=1088542 RepID=M6QDK8_9LEPT|nr:hypothetical protein [Leptospira weilii]EMN91305.1 hypothetical protein LEP1GSC108_3277 [Leptospira weilii str. UI 13098]